MTDKIPEHAQRLKDLITAFEQSLLDTGIYTDADIEIYAWGDYWSVFIGGKTATLPRRLLVRLKWRTDLPATPLADADIVLQTAAVTGLDEFRRRFLAAGPPLVPAITSAIWTLEQLLKPENAPDPNQLPRYAHRSSCLHVRMVDDDKYKCPDCGITQLELPMSKANEST